MEIQFLLNLSLALHLGGLSISVGIVLAKYLIFKKVLSDISADRRRWTLMSGATGKLNTYLGIGIGVAILSGALMMYLAYAALMHQLWFHVKMAVLLIIIIAGIITTRRESKLRKFLSKGESPFEEIHTRLTRKVKLVAGLQLLLLIVIIILATFRFT